MSAEPWHGTNGGYNNRRCRCDACRAAHSAYMHTLRNTDTYRAWRRIQVRKWRAARKEAGL